MCKKMSYQHTKILVNIKSKVMLTNEKEKEIRDAIEKNGLKINTFDIPYNFQITKESETRTDCREKRGELRKNNHSDYI